MTIRRMTLTDLELVLGWAAEEGWNPGLVDAAAFYAADPAGFFLKEVDGQPVAAVSVVNNSDTFAFLGLYLCRPEFRGQAHGMEVWRAGVAHAGERYIGLDGVPDQEANDKMSGFKRHGRTVRYRGSPLRVSGALVRPSTSSEIDILCDLDRSANGVRRDAFAEAWFTDTKTRRTLVLFDGGAETGFATYRKCRDGLKIGPLYANSLNHAKTLSGSSPPDLGGGPVLIDVPDVASLLAAHLQESRFEPTFETARMYSTEPLAWAQPNFFSIASMELG